jgi:hypothetical protein
VVIKPEFFDRLIALGLKYIELYLEEKFDPGMLITCPSMRPVVMSMYRRMIGYGQLEPIETWSVEDKQRLWTLCKPYTATLSKIECIEFAKCYAALDRLAAIKEEL